MQDKPKFGMFKKLILIILIVSVIVLGIYLTYFRRTPAADILAANLDLDSRDDIEDFPDNDVLDQIKSSQRMWDTWVKDNNYVAIGKLYNHCNESTRMHVGRVIMLQDKINRGVTSKTFANFSLENEIIDGYMYLSCDYNGNTIYTNQWKLCTVEEGMDDRIIFCPIQTGYKTYVKQLKIPNYLPKGHYSTKARMTNQDGIEIGCAIVAFSI